MKIAQIIAWDIVQENNKNPALGTIQVQNKNQNMQVNRAQQMNSFT